ncbi:MAG: efflux RND transporter periplasmic adaptor subunit [Blastocatellia bacterium]|nr:efflux RND transporter periplasmic adaptor subunit [Blastocatellia bacterium]
MKTPTSRKKLIILVFLLIISTVIATYFWDEKSSADEFITATVVEGDISNNVMATGVIQAITTVQVGSQQSGTISWLGADFNSQVKKGQIIARLDPSTLQAQLDNVLASLQNAITAEEMARKAYNQELAAIESSKANLSMLAIQSKDSNRLATRNKELANVISARELELSIANAQMADARYQQALAQVKQAEASASSAKVKIDQTIAQVNQIKANLQQAKINLERTIINSPIDGIVISRNVDVGQTVAASLQAPTLFTIANDLSKMQVLVNIDEADVGSIKEGQIVNFTVDAFPKDIFRGAILQVRFNPITTQNVVIYNAVVNFDNPQGKLRPGMTANVTIPIEHRENVLLIPNAALRFKPSSEELEKLSETSKTVQDKPNQSTRRQNRDKTDARTSPNDSDLAEIHKVTIWTLNSENKYESRRLKIGITDGKVTEVISGNIKKGDKIVVSKVGTNKSTQTQSSSPFDNRPRMSTGRRGV